MSWEEVVSKGQGVFKFYWNKNEDDIYKSEDVLDDIERDIIYSFIRYTEESNGVEIEIEAVEIPGFHDVMEKIRNGSGGIMGASTISITEDRARYMRFTPSYLPDIAVLVSGAQLPLAYTQSEIQENFKGAVAITVDQTTLEDGLNRLSQDLGYDFEYLYVSETSDIIEAIGLQGNAFGYVDLPNLMDISVNEYNVQRQFYYPIKLSGLALAYPIDSDWEAPIQAYFGSEQYLQDKSGIINKYLGEDVHAIFNQLSRSVEFGPYEEIVIATRERELQFRELLEAAQRDKDKSTRIFLLACVAVIALFSVIFFFARYQIKARTNVLLIGQQRTIEKRNQQLTRLNQEKNDLIEVLAHDLRTPLSKIAGFSRLVNDSDQIRPEEKELNGYIMKSSEKMESMISKILDVEAIESGKRNLKLEKLDVSILQQEVIAELEDKARVKEIEIKIGDCPDCYVLGDRFYLRQIIENLLSNAIKFSPKGKEIEISAEMEGEYVCIAVSDQGPGIEEEDRDRLFNKYQTAARPTDGEASTGLGLWIVRLYSEIMQGSVMFETELNKGTTFYVRLPVAN